MSSSSVAMPRSRMSADSAVSIRQRRLIVSCWPVRASSKPARMRLELSLICTAAAPRCAKRCGARSCLAAERRKRDPRRAAPWACPRQRSLLHPGRSPNRRSRPAAPRLHAVAAHAGEHDAERSGAVDRADRSEHRIDRRHAAADAAPVCQADDARLPERSSVRWASPGATRMRSGTSAMPSSATRHSRCATDPS